LGIHLLRKGTLPVFLSFANRIMKDRWSNPNQVRQAFEQKFIKPKLKLEFSMV